MKKNVLIGVLILLVALSMIFARLKASEAERFGVEAQGLNRQVELLTAQAEELQQRALEAAAHAAEERARTEELFKECQSKK